MDIKDTEKCENKDHKPNEDISLKDMNNKSKNNINNSLLLESLAVILWQNQKDIRQNMANIESKGECFRELPRE